MSDVNLTLSNTADDTDRYKDGPYYISNTGEWHRFCEWVAEILPDEDYQAVRTLCKLGRVMGTDQLSKELLDAATMDGIPGDVKMVLRDLTDWVGVGHDGEMAVIST